MSSDRDLQRRRAAAAVALGGALLALAAGDAAAQVRINEVFTGDLPFEVDDDTVELRNLGHLPIDLSGWRLRTYSAPQGQVPAPDPEYVFPAGTVVPGRGFLCVRDNGPGFGGAPPATLHTGFDWPWHETSSVEVVLLDSAGVAHDYVLRRLYSGVDAPHKPSTTNWSGALTAIGSVIARQQSHDTDEARDWKVRNDFPTRNAPNPGQHGDGSPHERIMITEVSWGHPDGVEITNFSHDPIDLTHWRIHWHDGTLRVSSSIPHVLWGGRTVVVTEPGGDLPLPPGVPRISALPILGTKGQAFSVALVDPSGIVVDEVRIAGMDGSAPPNLFGRFVGAVERGVLTGDEGDVGIERYWGYDSDRASDWTERPGRSFGLENRSSGRRTPPITPPKRVLISEVASAPELIELVNAEPTPVDLENHFLLLSGSQGGSVQTLRPFRGKTIVPPGGYVVIGETPTPPLELPAGVPYLRVDDLGQAIAFGPGELALALYDDEGNQLDAVRAARVDSERVHNDPRLPGPRFSFVGGVRRSKSVGGGSFARFPATLDTDRASDFAASIIRTMGFANAGKSAPVPHADALDVVLDSAGGGGATVIVNAGPEKAGQLVLAAVCPAWLGEGPIFGLPVTAQFLVTPPVAGPLDAQGSRRFDVPAHVLPAHVAFHAVWLVAKADQPVLDLRTLVLSYDANSF